MLLQAILEKLDTELNRLYSLRKVIAELKQVPPALQISPPQIALVPEPAIPELTEVAARPVRRRGRAATQRLPRAATAKSQAPKPTPLRHEIPRGPVVISPGQLAHERAQRLSAQVGARVVPKMQEAETADIDGQSRALASRWMSGSLAS